MSNRLGFFLTFTLTLMLLALAACGAASESIPPTVTPTLIPAPTTESASALEDVLTTGQPTWMTLPLTNARTGESFTLADFAGKTVYVEPMATWCTNCRLQQNIVRDVRAALGDTDYVWLSLSVETSLTAADLAAYADRENYGWTFAVASPDLLGALVTQFGMTISNPPSTPHFLIRPDGTVSSLSTGLHQAADLTAQITSARGA